MSHCNICLMSHLTAKYTYFTTTWYSLYNTLLRINLNDLLNDKLNCICCLFSFG